MALAPTTEKSTPYRLLGTVRALDPKATSSPPHWKSLSHVGPPPLCTGLGSLALCSQAPLSLIAWTSLSWFTHCPLHACLSPAWARPGAWGWKCKGDEVKLIVCGHWPPTCPWSHSEQDHGRSILVSYWSPDRGPITPIRGTVRRNFLEEVALQESTHLHLPPL